MATPRRIRKPIPIGGLVTARPPDTLPDVNTPRCINVHFRFGEARERPGVAGGNPPPIAEKVWWIGSYLPRAGTRWTVMITTTKIYRRGDTSPGAPDDWFEITGPGFTNSIRPSVTFGEAWMFFTGGEKVFRWDGDDATGYVAVDSSISGWEDPGSIWPSGDVSARFISYFNDRLVTGYISETTVGSLPARIRWPENGDHAKWDDSIGEGAGFLELFEEGEEAISGMLGLQDRLIVYKPRSIYEISGTGTLNPVHVSQVRSRGIGCPAAWTIASNGLAHFFLGIDGNVYAWDGIRLTPIGDPILDELRATFDLSLIDDYFGVVCTNRDEYWLIFNNDNVFVFDYRRGTWTRDTFPNISALGNIEQTIDAVLWNSPEIATLTWDLPLISWEAYKGVSVACLMGGRSTGDTFLLDEQTGDDYFAIGSIVDKVLETPDYYFPSVEGPADPFNLGTVKRLLLAYKFVNSEPFEVGVSLDRGATWTVETITPSTSGYSVVDFNVTGNVVRFRFRSSTQGGAFRWRNFTYEFVEAGFFRP